MGDGETKQAMIESNLGLVHALADGYRGRGVPYDDLMQEGTVGLTRLPQLVGMRGGVEGSWARIGAGFSGFVTIRTRVSTRERASGGRFRRG